MKAPQPVSRGERVAFELDRFEVVGDDSCELEGRWFGVRGRRFMRPALTIVRDGEPTRVLADLAGKPWAAKDGEPWTATFPRPDGDQDVPEAELTVAPDINIPLPAPKNGARPRSASGTSRKKTPSRTKSSRQEGSSATASTNGARKRRAPAKVDPERQRLQQQLERAEVEKAEAASRIEALLDELGQARGERDEAVEAREALAAERDQALTERDAALAALATHADVETRHRAALKARDNALAERDAALLARGEAVAKAESLAKANERLHTELTQASAPRGPAPLVRHAAQDAPVYHADIRLLPRVIAVIALLSMVVALLIVLRVV